MVATKIHHNSRPSEAIAGEMFVSGDLVGQLVLLKRSSITGRLGWPRCVLANLVFEIFWYFVMTVS